MTSKPIFRCKWIVKDNWTEPTGSSEIFPKDKWISFQCCREAKKMKDSDLG